MTSTKRHRAASARHSSFITPHSSLLHRSGFSFAEVMFAVVLLGIGFIMIAAVFPVGIKQSKNSLDQTTAAFTGDQKLTTWVEAERLLSLAQSADP